MEAVAWFIVELIRNVLQSENISLYWQNLSQGWPA